MRIIDADALLKGKTDHEMISTHLIWNAPTVDAEPVRHGHWTRKLDTRFGPLLNDMLYCSECGVAFSTDYLIRNSFCPNCGAKMDGKRVTVRAKMDEEAEDEDNR